MVPSSSRTDKLFLRFTGIYWLSRGKTINQARGKMRRLADPGRSLARHRLFGVGKNALSRQGNRRLKVFGEVVDIDQEGFRIQRSINIQITERVILSRQRQSHYPELIRIQNAGS